MVETAARAPMSHTFIVLSADLNVISDMGRFRIKNTRQTRKVEVGCREKLTRLVPKMYAQRETRPPLQV